MENTVIGAEASVSSCSVLLATHGRQGNQAEEIKKGTEVKKKKKLPRPVSKTASGLVSLKCRMHIEGEVGDEVGEEVPKD